MIQTADNYIVFIEAQNNHGNNGASWIIKILNNLEFARKCYIEPIDLMYSMRENLMNFFAIPSRRHSNEYSIRIILTFDKKECGICTHQLEEHCPRNHFRVVSHPCKSWDSVVRPNSWWKLYVIHENREREKRSKSNGKRNIIKFIISAYTN